MKKTVLYILPLLLTALTSCYDDLNLYPELGEGTADVSITMDFMPMTPVEANTGSTRSSGIALSGIDNLILFIYSADSKELTDIRYSEKGDLKNLYIAPKDGSGANTSTPEGPQAESTTSRATFTLPNIEAGYYYIYAAANVGEEYIPRDKSRAMADFKRIEDLKNISLRWDGRNIATNRQMLGYMTSGDYDIYEEGSEAPRVGIGVNSNRLHCWLKRAASKVTVVFDGSGLHDNVWIYIKNVTIHDIPVSCPLGADNAIRSEAEMIEDGETISYDNGSANWADWLAIARGSGKKGAVAADAAGNPLPHSEYAEALYFYENLQGDYEGKERYDKRQQWQNLGWVPEKGEYDYKDNVPYGTYIEVEAFYLSDNPGHLSRGEIKYRFMLGKNITYNYDAARNHHFKVTLGFRGYANQPDWHIVYHEEGEVYTPSKAYYMSYQYNRRSEFPIRIKGQPQSLEVEIVENNWAPYQERPGQPDYMQVPDQRPGTSSSVTEQEFQWNRAVYTNSLNKGSTAAPKAYYGLQSPFSKTGAANYTYSAKQKAAGAPEQVTPVWAGFLALYMPGNTRDDIPPYLLQGLSYSNASAIAQYKNDFYSKGQNVRTFSQADLSFPGWKEGMTMEKTVGTGNNACTIRKDADGTLTVNLPMWTREKTMLGISGFSGNNPYDAYRRRAKVMITTKFDDTNTDIQVKDVFQVRRVVNPKGIWHTWNNTDPFRVRLCIREDMNATEFTSLTSEGAWRAYVLASSDGHAGFVYLTGGTGRDPETGGIIGATDSEIEFTINFNGPGAASVSRCAIIQVEYHGYSCSHNIFVRQGYREPLAIVPGGAKWSAFSLYSCATGSDINDQFATSWNGSNYIDATLTASPLALGSFFKRGNYNGITISNNTVAGSNVSPGRSHYFTMSAGQKARWSDIKGLAYHQGYSGTLVKWGASDVHNTFEWRRFRARVNIGDGSTEEVRQYRVPTIDDFNALTGTGVSYGVGVLYADGTVETQMNVSHAYGFEDFDNDGDDMEESGGNHRGMRGIMVYNTTNAHQLFFPIGARGMGRRTITGYTSTSFDDFGILRYGGVTYTLTQDANIANEYRPIPFNMPAAPGAIYWLSKLTDGYPAWDMNYFDQNFNAYDYAVSFSSAAYTSGNGVEFGNGGDALPIKLVLAQ